MIRLFLFVLLQHSCAYHDRNFQETRTHLRRPISSQDLVMDMTRHSDRNTMRAWHGETAQSLEQQVNQSLIESEHRRTAQTPTTRPSLRFPTQTQTKRPTLASIVIPNGPFITASIANEVVVIPDPPVPSSSSPYNCPHLNTGLIDWHSISTWGGPIPTSGNVTLPHNSRVIIRKPVLEKFTLLTIPSTSELIFGANVTGISFHTQGINVQGKLTIGSETCPMKTPVTITLYGKRPSNAVTNVPSPESKGIVVTGRIDIHGLQFYRTWTRLALTVNPGDSVLMLQHKVNWMSGQQIVLVTTAMKDSREWHRNEVATIKRVVRNPKPGVGAAVILAKPVRYQHVANRGYQGEVGLLSRQVKIQGDDQSEPTDPDPLTCQRQLSSFGDQAIPCPNKELTGYGGHILIHKGGKGYVEGVELYRMGQTNVLGRYPMHFHLLGDGCPGCYFRHSAVHRSFYRCISVHGTNYIRVLENVGFDVTGYCYYIEDGTEHDNRIEFNLGAHIHMIGPEPPRGVNQSTTPYKQSDTLANPADVAAAAFYVTNVQNYIIGNAASGGWAGFAFPILDSPIFTHRYDQYRPSNARELSINGNTAHSTGWWWKGAAAFYFGGSLYYNSDNILEYQAGRDLKRQRSSCFADKCATTQGCGSYCREWEQAWITVSNSKAFLTAGVGFNSWSGRMDVIGYECHDCGLAMQSLSTDGFSARNMLIECRSQQPIALPNSAKANAIPADGFTWYDTSQEHILYDVTFRNCGYRSQQFNQYYKGLTRGCADESDIGCTPESSVWGMVTHSDEFVPEVMQATRGIKFQNCGRRFRQLDFRLSKGRFPTSVSGRLQNWLDMDGSVTGLKVRSVAASGLADAGMWWDVDNEAIFDSQGPLWFYKLTSGPQRGLGSFSISWDSNLDSAVGKTQCGNGNGLPCDYVGRMKHLGVRFKSDPGLPITANADIVGPVGGFGWKLELDRGAPKAFRIYEVEVDPATPLLLSIAYPAGTSFNITWNTPFCKPTAQYTCSAGFIRVDSIAKVRKSMGNAYFVDSNGVLTIRVVQTPKTFVGRPDFFLPQYSDVGRDGLGVALERFERGGIRLPRYTDGPFLSLSASCRSSGAYCLEQPNPYEPVVCPNGYSQVAYDTCTLSYNGTIVKLFSDGTTKVISRT